jgi:hypothetical protein
MDDLAFSYDNPWVETSSKCLFVVHRWAQEFLASPTKYFYPEAVYCFRAGHRYSAASLEDIFFTSPLSRGAFQFVRSLAIQYFRHFKHRENVGFSIYPVYGTSMYWGRTMVEALL